MVYPLKFLFTYLASALLGGGGMAHFPDGRVEPMLKGNDGYWMMLVYNAGFIAVFGVFVLLYWHAWQKRDELELDVKERFLTKERLGANACFAGMGLISTCIVVVGGGHASARAGMVYTLLGPLLAVYYSVMGRRFRRFETATTSTAPQEPSAATKLDGPRARKKH